MVFSFSTVNLINILFISGGIGVCGLCFLDITSSTHLRKEVRRYFQLFFAIIELYIVSHLVRQIMEGVPGQAINTAMGVVTFIELLSAGIMAYMMSLLILSVTNPEKSVKRYEVVFSVLLALHFVILIADRFGHFVFYIDADNIYHRGTVYLFSNICPTVMLVLEIVIMAIYGRKLGKLVRSAFWTYLIAPAIALIIQSAVYGLQMIIFATVGGAVYMFAVIVQDQKNKYEKQQIENSRIETELTMASGIQADMLPNIFPAFPEHSEFDIYAKMDPAKEVGGDFYDFFLVDDDHLCMLIADVSGKGVPAALFMMATKIILQNNAMLGKSPAQILTDTNAAICSNNRGELFVTVWLGILEISTGKLTAANAGHEYPAMKNGRDGSFRLVKDKHCFVLGGLEGMRYKEYEFYLEPGSKIFLYTDGVPEATDPDNKLFGTDRMLNALNADPKASPEQVLANVRNNVDVFVRNAEQFDDLTMLCFEYSGKDDK